MKVTDANLERFTAWLQNRGRGDNTAKIYCSHLRNAHDAGEISTARLVGKLSPNTKRGTKAALAAWAKFTKDGDLRDALEDVKLPPARRVTAKLPLTREQWAAYVRHLRTAKIPHRDELIRSIMVIIAVRGLRKSDALRITRREVSAALSTGKLSFRGKGGKRSEFAAAPIRAELEDLHARKGDWETLQDLVSPSMEAAQNRIWRRMRILAESIEIDGVYPHRLRRTYATRFLEQLQGDPQAIIKLQKHMDWESLGTAASYADAVNTDELDVVGGRMVDEILR